VAGEQRALPADRVIEQLTMSFAIVSTE